MDQAKQVHYDGVAGPRSVARVCNVVAVFVGAVIFALGVMMTATSESRPFGVLTMAAGLLSSVSLFGYGVVLRWLAARYELAAGLAPGGASAEPEPAGRHHGGWSG